MTQAFRAWEIIIALDFVEARPDFPNEGVDILFEFSDISPLNKNDKTGEVGCQGYCNMELFKDSQWPVLLLLLILVSGSSSQRGGAHFRHKNRIAWTSSWRLSTKLDTYLGFSIQVCVIWIGYFHKII